MISFVVRLAAFAGCAGLLYPAFAAAPNVIYTVSGTFAQFQESGEDLLGLAGEPFSVRIVANEALQPVKQTVNSAFYDALTLEGQVNSFAIQESLYVSTRRASLYLQAGNPGHSDLLTFTFPYNLIGVPLTIRANVSMPRGTLASTAIQPFTAPVSLYIVNATATVSAEEGGLTTTLGVAEGILNATVGPPPSQTTVVNQFSGENGATPVGLTSGPSGVLYGTTGAGGKTGNGTVFGLSHSGGSAWTETVLYNFAGGSDGATPAGGVLLGNDGSLYGLTYSGGDDGNGTAYQLTPTASGAWAETVVYSFPARPAGSLVADASGVLYGVTEFGGANDLGSVFQLTPPSSPGGAWTEATLYSFTAKDGDGAYPVSGLMIEPDGSLYGATAFGSTSSGGIVGMGTIYRLTPPAAQGSGWTESVLYAFTGAPDGSYPEGPLVALNGVLCGITVYGGNGSIQGGYGTVFSLEPRASGTWHESVIYNFQGPGLADGAFPAGGLLVGENGVLYGVTTLGGAEGWGTVFRLNSTGGIPDWREEVLADFDVFNGANPVGSLAGGAPGEIYGITSGGGSSPCDPQNPPAAFCGLVFAVKP